MSKSTQKSTTLDDAFATNLKAFRVRARLSQQAVADQTGLSVSYISMLERGRRSAPLGTIDQIATALGVVPHTLLAPPTAKALKAAA